MKIKYSTAGTSCFDNVYNETGTNSEYENKLFIAFSGPPEKELHLFGTVLTEEEIYWVDLEKETVTIDHDTDHIRPVYLELLCQEERDLLDYILLNWKNISLLDFSEYKQITIQLKYNDLFI